MITTDRFVNRHNGPRKEDVELMLKKIGASSLNELIDQTIPKNIRLKKPLNLPAGLTEFQYHKHLRSIAAKNKMYRTYIGLGYYNTIIPPVIQRNILKTPAGTRHTLPTRPKFHKGVWRLC